MKLDVVNNAKRNIVFSLINKIVIMVCPFIVRTVVYYILGYEYLGLDSLFVSVLAVLSLSEMGFSSAIAYNMYKPVAEGDIEKVNALLAFYRKAYYIVGIAILVLGCCSIPFLPNIINGSYPENFNIVFAYLLYLINASISYFTYGYLTVLVTVYQREDVNSAVNSIIVLLQSALRIMVLLFTQNYYLYILIMPICTLINNFCLGYVIKRKYPQYECAGELSPKDRSSIKQLVTGTFIQKSCAVTRNSLDSICISYFLGLALTAIYSNYIYIFNTISTVVGIVGSAFSGGVGNHVATKSIDENFEELQKIDFVYLWLSGWCTVCLLCLYQPFMRLWMGEEMLLDISSVVLLCLYFYLLRFGDMRSMYNAANGLWWEQKWRSLSETILNLILNIVLGKLFGINGIIIATIISLILCNCLWATQILFDKYFTKKYLYMHYKTQLLYMGVTVIACVTTYILCSLISIKNSVLELIVKSMLCVIIPNIIFLLMYHKKNIFVETMQTLLRKRITYD